MVVSFSSLRLTTQPLSASSTFVGINLPGNSAQGILDLEGKRQSFTEWPAHEEAKLGHLQDWQGVARIGELWEPLNLGLGSESPLTWANMAPGLHLP